MGSGTSMLILGTLLLALGQWVFGSGLLMRFAEFTTTFTSPDHLLSGNTSTDLGLITRFIGELVIYYGAAAILVFLFGLFSKKK